MKKKTLVNIDKLVKLKVYSKRFTDDYVFKKGRKWLFGLIVMEEGYYKSKILDHDEFVSNDPKDIEDLGYIVDRKTKQIYHKPEIDFYFTHGNLESKQFDTMSDLNWWIKKHKLEDLLLEI